MTEVYTDPMVQRFRPLLPNRDQNRAGLPRIRAIVRTGYATLDEVATVNIVLDRQALGKAMDRSRSITLTRPGKGTVVPTWKNELLSILEDDSFYEKHLSNGEAEAISLSTLHFAKELIKALPRNIVPPTVTPDGEGDVVFWWVGPKNLVVIVEGPKLHIVLEPGTGQSIYIEDLDFSNRVVPSEILQILPQV